MSDPQAEALKLRADLARDRLLATLGELRDRLMPGHLAGQALASTKAKAVAAAESAVDQVAARPGLTIGLVGVGAALLLRLRRTRSTSETDAPPRRSTKTFDQKD